MADPTRDGFEALQKTKRYKDWAASTPGNTIDAGKLAKKLAGTASPKPGSGFGLALWRILDALKPATPPPPPPPPPPPHVKVAPRTYNKVLPGGSDARFCVRGLPEVDGSGGLRVHDDVAQYDKNGLCTNGRRSPDMQVPGLRQANNMNGLDPCTLYGGLTAWPGDPLKNTGSWAV